MNRSERKLLLRAALALQRVYHKNHNQRTDVDIPIQDWERVQHQYRRVLRAESRRWYLAANRCRRQLQRGVRQLMTQVSRIEQQLSQQPPAIPSLQLLFDELRSLSDEFEPVEFNLRNAEISVHTEPIELEGHDLGPFAIVLHWNQDSGQLGYSVKPLEPNWPVSGDRHPHPHINDETLCEGDGKTLIAAALEEGRIGDFFILIRQILETYNPYSAYIKLEDWHGFTCEGCLVAVHDEDMDYCYSCNDSLCMDCLLYCEDCAERFCFNCTSNCAHCDDRYCESCLQPCVGCDERFCSQCLEDDLCPSCLENQHAESEDTSTDPPSPAENTPQTLSTAAVHPVCVVQTAPLA